jgi:hypothetical protein
MSVRVPAGDHLSNWLLPLRSYPRPGTKSLMRRPQRSAAKRGFIPGPQGCICASRTPNQLRQTAQNLLDTIWKKLA